MIDEDKFQDINIPLINLNNFITNNIGGSKLPI